MLNMCIKGEKQDELEKMEEACMFRSKYSNPSNAEANSSKAQRRKEF